VLLGDGGGLGVSNDGMSGPSLSWILTLSDDLSPLRSTASWLDSFVLRLAAELEPEEQAEKERHTE